MRLCLSLILLHLGREGQTIAESLCRGWLDREGDRVEQAVIVGLILEERVNLLIWQRVSAHEGGGGLPLDAGLLVRHLCRQVFTSALFSTAKRADMLSERERGRLL